MARPRTTVARIQPDPERPWMPAGRNEHPRARRAFEAFVAAGPGTSVEMFGKTRPTDEDGKVIPPGTINRWAGEFLWHERSRAFHKANMTNIGERTAAKAVAVQEGATDLAATALPILDAMLRRAGVMAVAEDVDARDWAAVCGVLLRTVQQVLAVTGPRAPATVVNVSQINGNTGPDPSAVLQAFQVALESEAPDVRDRLLSRMAAHLNANAPARIPGQLGR